VLAGCATRCQRSSINIAPHMTRICTHVGAGVRKGRRCTAAGGLAGSQPGAVRRHSCGAGCSGGGACLWMCEHAPGNRVANGKLVARSSSRQQRSAQQQCAAAKHAAAGSSVGGVSRNPLWDSPDGRGRVHREHGRHRRKQRQRSLRLRLRILDGTCGSVCKPEVHTSRAGWGRSGRHAAATDGGNNMI
jgi:hypothetical protein